MRTRKAFGGLLLAASLAACTPAQVNAVIHAQRSEAQGSRWCAEDDPGWNGRDHRCLPSGWVLCDPTARDLKRCFIGTAVTVRAS